MAEQPLLIGNKYQKVRLIGTGGMGVVYEVFNIDAHYMHRALKILKEEFRTNADYIRRFEEEPRKQERLKHANIVRITDVGKDPDVGPYVVMDLINGVDLKQFLKRGGVLAYSEVLEFGVKLADALRYAHRRRVVHRDIKPENILITDEDREPILTDFGIAKQLRGDDTSVSDSTVGGFVGTYRYASPEQLRAEKDLDGRTDIYSLGCVLYSMYTGKAFLEQMPDIVVAGHVMSEDAWEHPLQYPTAPPEPFGLLIRRCLERDRSKRASADELITRLRECLSSYEAAHPVVEPVEPQGSGAILPSGAELAAAGQVVDLEAEAETRREPIVIANEDETTIAGLRADLTQTREAISRGVVDFDLLDRELLALDPTVPASPLRDEVQAQLQEIDAELDRRPDRAGLRMLRERLVALHHEVTQRCSAHQERLLETVERGCRALIAEAESFDGGRGLPADEVARFTDLVPSQSRAHAHAGNWADARSALATARQLIERARETTERQTRESISGELALLTPLLEELAQYGGDAAGVVDPAALQAAIDAALQAGRFSEASELARAACQRAETVRNEQRRSLEARVDTTRKRVEQQRAAVDLDTTQQLHPERVAQILDLLQRAASAEQQGDLTRALAEYELVDTHLQAVAEEQAARVNRLVAGLRDLVRRCADAPDALVDTARARARELLDGERTADTVKALRELEQASAALEAELEQLPNYLAALRRAEAARTAEQAAQASGATADELNKGAGALRRAERAWRNRAWIEAGDLYAAAEQALVACQQKIEIREEEVRRLAAVETQHRAELEQRRLDEQRAQRLDVARRAAQTLRGQLDRQAAQTHAAELLQHADSAFQAAQESTDAERAIAIYGDAAAAYDAVAMRIVEARRRQVAELWQTVDLAGAQAVAAKDLTAARELEQRAHEAEQQKNWAVAAKLLVEAAAAVESLGEHVGSIFGPQLAALTQELEQLVADSAMLAARVVGDRRTRAAKLLAAPPQQPSDAIHQFRDAIAALRAALQESNLYVIAIEQQATAQAVFERTTALEPDPQRLRTAQQLLSDASKALEGGDWNAAGAGYARAAADLVKLEEALVDERDAAQTSAVRARVEAVRAGLDLEIAAACAAKVLRQGENSWSAAQQAEKARKYEAAQAAYASAEAAYESVAAAVTQEYARRIQAAESLLQVALKGCTPDLDDLVGTAAQRGRDLLDGKRPSAPAAALQALEAAAAEVTQRLADAPAFRAAVEQSAAAVAARDRVASLKPGRRQTRNADALLQKAAAAAKQRDWAAMRDGYAAAAAAFVELGQTLKEQPPVNRRPVAALVAGGALLVAAAVGLYVYNRQPTSTPPTPAPKLRIAKALPDSDAVALQENALQLFAVTAAGAPADTPIAVSWLLDGKPQTATGNEWRYQPDFDAAGAHEVQVVLKAGKQTDNRLWKVNVENVNRPPRITTTTPDPATKLRAKVGDSVAFHAEAEDADRDKLTYAWSVDGKPADGQGRDFKLDDLRAGHAVAVSASDDSAKAEAHWQVSVNQAPRFAKTEPSATKVSAKRGDTVSFLADATDADQDKLTYTWSTDGKPEKATGHELKLKIDGDHKVSVTVSDGTESVANDWQVAALEAPLFTFNFTPPTLERVRFGEPQELALSPAPGVATAGVTYAWKVDGSGVATGPRFVLKSYSPAWVRDGAVAIVATADGGPGQSFSHEWKVRVVPPMPQIRKTVPPSGVVEVEVGATQPLTIDAGDPVGAQRLSFVFRVDGKVEKRSPANRFDFASKDDTSHVIEAAVEDNYQQAALQPIKWTLQPSSILGKVGKWVDEYKEARRTKDAQKEGALRGLPKTQVDKLAEAYSKQKNLQVSFSEADIKPLGSNRARAKFQETRSFTGPDESPVAARLACEYTFTLVDGRLVAQDAGPQGPCAPIN
jgi:tRNA A-37 threonylcarbamoyl transferase component Bud32/Arc/MetJ-type ribon-helix-helix transcriptional regulator